MSQRLIFAIASALEVVTGLMLLVVPSLVVSLLLGDAPISGPAIPARMAGLALLALGCMCWPKRCAGVSTRQRSTLLSYNVLATLGLASLGVFRDHTGMLLWPAVAIHGTLTLLITGSRVAARPTGDAEPRV